MVVDQIAMSVVMELVVTDTRNVTSVKYARPPYVFTHVLENTIHL